MLDATLITCEDAAENTYRHSHSAADAAEMLGVSESAVRRTAKRLGVKRIAGIAVAGMIRFSASRFDVVLPYSK